MEPHENALYYLRRDNSRLREPLQTLNLKVLNDVDFYHAPGGSEHHHNFRHGLVIHVNEVMTNVNCMTNYSPSGALVTAVIWHDYMKIKDYGFDMKDTFNDRGVLTDSVEVITKKPYRKLINHVAGSAMEFHRHACNLLDTEELEHIEHLLLSHHGRKEWGSPVEPMTAEAFILHAADMMSAHGVNL